MSGGNVTGIIELKLKTSLSPDTHKFESIMKKNTIVSIEQDVVKDIKANRKKRIKGSLFVNSDGHVDFEAEKKGERGSDCETLYETNCGRLYMSECSIFIKSRGKKSLGRGRCADVLESDLCVLLEQLRKCKQIKK